MTRAVMVIWFLFLVAIGGGAWWYLFGPGTAPEGQRPLGDAAEFRQAFQAGVGKNRFVAILSPTTPADLGAAQYMQALLMEYDNDALDVHVVWQPSVSTDWAPTTDGMARVADRRARHYWDKGKAVRAEAGPGQVLVYARGAGLDKPAIRVTDWKNDVAKIREFLGAPVRKQ